MAFAENLKRLREKTGMTQNDLAVDVGVSQTMIAQYERGLKLPTVVVGVDIAKILGTTVEMLVGEQEQEGNK